MRAFVGNTIGQRPGERGVRQTPRSPVLRLHGREDQSEGQVPSRGVDVREPKFDGADMSEVVVMSKADAVGASFKGGKAIHTALFPLYCILTLHYYLKSSQ